jgi:sulfur carrier protein
VNPANVGSTATITVNGEPHEVASDLTVAELTAKLAVRGRFAVEVNGAIVPRSRHADHALATGDVIEIVKAIGGG